LTNLNGKNLNEDEDGAAEIIRGGDGDDTLYVYGTADLSNYDITGIEHIEIRSDVSITVEQLRNILSVNGDGHSTIRILAPDTNTTPIDLDVSSIRFSNLGQIHVGENVRLFSPNIAHLGGATTLSGAGSLICNNASGFDLTGITRTTSLKILNQDGSVVFGGNLTEEIIAPNNSGTTTGTNNNDVIDGTAYNDTLIGLPGADVINGGNGDDILYGDEDRIGAFSIQTNDNGSGPNSIDNGSGSNYLINNLGGDAGFGENILGANDDDSTGAIDIRSVFGEEGVNFFGRKFTHLYVNNNGNITFAGPSGTYTPEVINAGVSNPIIAPFWADIDTRGASPVTPTSGGNSKGTNRVYYDLDTENKTFTVTWDDVGYYSGHTDKLNAFQLQLKDNGTGDFDIVFRYEDINWVTGDASRGGGGLGGTVARAGYSSGTANGYYEMPESGNQEAMLSLERAGERKFSVRNGLTLEDSNNDRLTGGAGNDIIIGGDGDHDVAIFSGALSQYTITSLGEAIKVSDNISNRDGVDTIFSSTEYLRFSDGEVISAPYFGTNQTASEVFTNANRLSLAAAVANTQVSDTSNIIDPNLSGGGYYKLLFALSAASYVHNIPGLGYTGPRSSSLLGSETTASDEAGRLKLNSYNYIAGALHFLSSSEIGISNEGQIAQGNNFSYAFSDGFYVATDYNGINASSVATVARSSDALFLAFRGTDIDSATDYSDVVEDIGFGSLSMTAHYERYQPLFNAIDTYLESHPSINKVYVTGHSLGGEMANMYMYNHPNNNIKYQSVTFEAANKKMPDFDDPRSINFEMKDDPVPDLGILTLGDTHYGKTVYLEYENSPFVSSHYMANIAPQFDAIADRLPEMDLLPLNTRIYTDDDGDGVIITNNLSQYVFNTIDILSSASMSVPIIGREVAIGATVLPIATASAIAAEDQAEYNATSYNINTLFTKPGGTLIVKQIPAISEATFYITDSNTDSNIDAVAIKNGPVFTARIDINAKQSDHGVILIGNDSEGLITGSSYNDILIGSGGKDVLCGGDGNDYLYGSDYKDIINDIALNMGNYKLTPAGANALRSNAGSDAIDDVSYLYGGKGNDVMRGGGDNDYFFVDVTIRSVTDPNNSESSIITADTANIDTIHDFYVSGLDPSANDWLVFSADQLGIRDQISSLRFSTTTILDETAYIIPYNLSSGREEHFFNVNNISEYTSGSSYLNDEDDFTWPIPDDNSDALFAFILENSTGNLYFDLDGNRDYGDEVCIAHLDVSDSYGSDSLSDMHANQILIVDNFDFLNNPISSSVIG